MVIATPGRLIDLVDRKVVSLAAVSMVVKATHGGHGLLPQVSGCFATSRAST
jgi:hypothetical protein